MKAMLRPSVATTGGESRNIPAGKVHANWVSGVGGDSTGDVSSTFHIPTRTAAAVSGAATHMNHRARQNGSVSGDR
jgi:hypothetical protein